MKKYFQTGLTGALWLTAANAIGIVSAYLLFKIPVLGFIRELISPDQTFIRLIFILFAFLIIVFVNGYLTGWLFVGSITKDDKQAIKEKYARKAGFSFGLTRSLLIIPLILIMSIAALYNNGSEKEPLNFIYTFAIFGGIYGLFIGLLIGLTTFDLKRIWRVILYTMAGFVISGGLVGGVLYLLTYRYQLGIEYDFKILRSMLVLIIFSLPSGSLLAITYKWFKDNPAEKRKVKNPLVQKLIRIGLFVFLMFFLSTLYSIINFLYINDAELATKYVNTTVGVGWSDPIGEFSTRSIKIPSTTKVEFVNSSGEAFVVSCAEGNISIVNSSGDNIQNFIETKCLGVPDSVLDRDGNVHIVWFGENVKDVNGVERNEGYIFESIENQGKWSDPLIVGTASEGANPSLYLLGSDIHLYWRRDGGGVYHAIQPRYVCNSDLLTEIEMKLFTSITTDGFREKEDKISYCQNNFLGFIYMPNPEEEYSDQNKTPNGGFDKLSVALEEAEYEVLFSMMQWEENVGNYGPGYVFTQGIGDLYKKVKENPENYPRGVNVKILLGNYPVMSDFKWGIQTINVLRDLKAAGVDEMVNEEIGWKVEVANFEGTYPHSHTKFMVIDGKKVLGMGFNYNYVHYEKEHPSGLGEELYDLGMFLEGPVAQETIFTFDDQWDGAQQVKCITLENIDDNNWENDCEVVNARVEHLPEVLRYHPAGDTNSFSLYRTKNIKTADNAVSTLLSSATDTIDIYEVNFSLQLICALAVLNEDLCTYDDNSLKYMQSILEAIENENVKVRVIMEKINMNGMENTVSGKVFLKELEKRGLKENVELRFFGGRMHAKSFLIDSELLAIGSHNFHYSAWGDGGLAEYSLTTNDKEAIDEYKTMYEYLWNISIPFEEYQYSVK